MTKKRFEEAVSEYRSEEGQPFGTYDDDVFAALDAAQVETGKIPIMQIWADVTQPRNIIPREIRGDWDGNPDALGDLLPRWIGELEKQGYQLPLDKMLRGKETKATRGLYEVQQPLLQRFLSVVNLAAQIRDVGLKQPVGVIETGGGQYRIIYGERRWTAFHLLLLVLDEARWMQIPAQVAKVSEWELAKIQAAENFHQAGLNAISKARQFAKLLILARKDMQDPPYDPWHALVVPGGCNRAWFAQVADGNLHPIPYGMGAEFERTLNISTNQMSQYRALLRLTGDHEIDNRLWDLGDQNDWSEGLMRDIRRLESAQIRQILDSSEDVENALREAVAAKIAAEKAQRTLTTVRHLDAEVLPSPSPSPLRVEGDYLTPSPSPQGREGNKEGAMPSAARANYGRVALDESDEDIVPVRQQINPFPTANKLPNEGVVPQGNVADLRQRFPLKAKVETFDGWNTRWIGEVVGYLENRVHVVDGFGKKWSFAPERLTLVQAEHPKPTPSVSSAARLVEDRQDVTLLRQLQQVALLLEDQRSADALAILLTAGVDQIRANVRTQERGVVGAALQGHMDAVAHLCEGILARVEVSLRRWDQIDEEARHGDG